MCLHSNPESISVSDVSNAVKIDSVCALSGGLHIRFPPCSHKNAQALLHPSSKGALGCARDFASRTSTVLALLRLFLEIRAHSTALIGIIWQSGLACFHTPTLRLAIVMIIIPAVMNSLQFWLEDNVFLDVESATWKPPQESQQHVETNELQEGPAIRKVAMSLEKVLDSDRSTLSSFMSSGDRQGNAPQSDEIIGILSIRSAQSRR